MYGIAEISQIKQTVIEAWGLAEETSPIIEPLAESLRVRVVAAMERGGRRRSGLRNSA
jgi:hypothetical protein